MSSPAVWPERLVRLRLAISYGQVPWLRDDEVRQVLDVVGAATRAKSLLDEPVILDRYGTTRLLGLFPIGKSSLNANTLVLRITQEFFQGGQGGLVLAVVDDQKLAGSTEYQVKRPGAVGRQLDALVEQISAIADLPLELPEE